MHLDAVWCRACEAHREPFASARRFRPVSDFHQPLGVAILPTVTKFTYVLDPLDLTVRALPNPAPQQPFATQARFHGASQAAHLKVLFHAVRMRQAESCGDVDSGGEQIRGPSVDLSLDRFTQAEHELFR